MPRRMLLFCDVAIKDMVILHKVHYRFAYEAIKIVTTPPMEIYFSGGNAETNRTFSILAVENMDHKFFEDLATLNRALKEIKVQILKNKNGNN